MNHTKYTPHSHALLLKGVAGQSASHEHKSYDWSTVKDEKLQRYLTKLTEPGATKMWDGWFTTHDATETTTMTESTKRQHARQERLMAKHWEMVTKQWQRGTLNKRARTGVEPGSHGRQRNTPLQTSITRFMTKAQTTTGRKSSTRKRKKDTEVTKVREVRPQRPTPEREDITDSQTDTDMEELPTTQETKQQKMDRTGTD